MSIDQLRPETTIQSVIGRVIVKIRKDLSIEQAYLASSVGVTQSTWSRIERGDSALTVEQLMNAAKALNVNASTILSEAEFAIRELKSQGVEISSGRGSETKSNNSAGSGAAMIGAAALGALVTAAIMKSKD